MLSLLDERFFKVISKSSYLQGVSLYCVSYQYATVQGTEIIFTSNEYTQAKLQKLINCNISFVEKINW